MLPSNRTLDELFRQAHSDGDTTMVSMIAITEEAFLGDLLPNDELNEAWQAQSDAEDKLEDAENRVDQLVYVLDIVAAYCESSERGLRKKQVIDLAAALRDAEKKPPESMTERRNFEDRIEAIFTKSGA